MLPPGEGKFEVFGENGTRWGSRNTWPPDVAIGEHLRRQKAPAGYYKLIDTEDRVLDIEGMRSQLPHMPSDADAANVISESLRKRIIEIDRDNYDFVLCYYPEGLKNDNWLCDVTAVGVSSTDGQIYGLEDFFRRSFNHDFGQAVSVMEPSELKSALLSSPCHKSEDMPQTGVYDFFENYALELDWLDASRAAFQAEEKGDAEQLAQEAAKQLGVPYVGKFRFLTFEEHKELSLYYEDRHLPY